MNKKSIAKECINVILLLINIKIPSIVYDYYLNTLKVHIYKLQ